MTFNPHTDRDRAEMLDAIGLTDLRELFAAVSDRVRFPALMLPESLTEMEAASRLSELAAKNVAFDDQNVFLGAGSYRHYVPATVGQILSRGEFYTAYTPYQPEVAQGTLQVIYEFQTMVAALLGMDIANASIYDGATALAEGALLATAAVKRRKRIVVAGTVHPHYRDVLQTYLSGLSLDLHFLPIPTAGFMQQPEDFAPYLDDDLAAIVVQYPNFFGGIEDVATLAEAAHGCGGLLVTSSYPVALGMLTSPGELGADVATAEGQPLGVAQSYGGPYVGLLATRQSMVRQMPGRLVGMTNDSDGKQGFVLALQTREQHIRRDKATSNICTNQGLMATAATVYMASVGPAGFAEVANRSYQNAHYLATQIASLDGWSLGFEDRFFNEFVARSPVPARDTIDRLQARGFLGGLDLGGVDDSLEQCILFTATEVNNRKSIDGLIAALAP